MNANFVPKLISASLAIIVAACTAPEHKCRAQDREQLLREVRANRVTWTDLFPNEVVRSRLLVQRGARTGQGEELLTTEFSALSNRVWRCDVVDDQGDHVLMRSNRFAFEAFKRQGTDSFQYGMLGFDGHVHKSVLQSMLTRNQLLQIPTHVFDLDLVEFLSLPGLTVEHVAPQQTSSGRPGQLVRWSLEASPPKVARAAYGDLLWLNQDGYLLEKVRWVIGTRPATASRTQDQPEFNFEVRYTVVNGRVIPTYARWAESNVTFVTELTDRQTSQYAADHYRAEAIGLRTPRAPLPWRWIWIVLGIGFALAAIFIWRSKFHQR